MKKIALHISQGTFTCVDIENIKTYQTEENIPTLNQITKRNQQQTQERNQQQTQQKSKTIASDKEELLIAVFTDNLLPCSCFFIKDKNNHFFIMAHADSITNILDPNCGLFATLEDKIKQFNLKEEDIEIYFESGATEYLLQNSTNYLKFVELYLKDKNKKYRLYFIKKEQNSEAIERACGFRIIRRVDDLTKNQENGFLLEFNESHKFDSNRRDAICYLGLNGIEFVYGFNGDRQDYNESDILSTVMKNKKIFNFALYNEKPVYFESQRFTARFRENELTTQYKKMITQAIIKRIYPDSPNKEEREQQTREQAILQTQKKQTESIIIKLLNEEELYLFPPICIYQGKNTGNLGNFKMEMKVYTSERTTSDSIQDKMNDYLKTIEEILLKIEEEEIESILVATTTTKNKESKIRELLINLRTEFFQMYNKISKRNNYFLRQNKNPITNDNNPITNDNNSITKDDNPTTNDNNPTTNDDLLEQIDLFELLEAIELINNDIGVGNTKNESGQQVEGHFVTYYKNVEVMDSIKDGRQVKQCCGLHAVEGALIVNEIANIFKEEFKANELEVNELKNILNNQKITQIYKNQKTEETDLLKMREMILEIMNEFDIIEIREQFDELTKKIEETEISLKKERDLLSECKKYQNEKFTETINILEVEIPELEKKLSNLNKEKQNLIDKIKTKKEKQKELRDHFKKTSKAYQKVLKNKEIIKEIIKDQNKNRIDKEASKTRQGSPEGEVK